LTEILRKKVHDAGIKMSLDEILGYLGNIRESVSLLSPEGVKVNLELRCNLRRWMRLKRSYLIL